MTDTKHLTIVRHAKSSWEDPDLDDHDRPLNPRGRRAAAAVGGHLRGESIEPALVLCSTATRTRQTLELLALGGHPEICFEDELYGATATGLLARLHRVADPTPSVLLIGHNPGVHHLAELLCGEQVPSFPTGAVARLRLIAATWAGLRPGQATLEGFVTPRELD